MASNAGFSEEALRNYEKIISNASDHISFIDKTYTYRLVNQTYLKVHGKSKEDIIGHTVKELLGEEIFNGFVKNYLDRCFAGESISYEQWFNFAVPGRRFMSVSYYPYFGEDDSIDGAVVISRDLTELKLAEELVKESEIKYRHLFENLNDAALVGDTETGLIVETNRRAEALFGMTRQELIGMHQSRLHPAPETYKEKFRDHVARGREADYEGEIIRKDGAIVPVNISASVITLGEKKLILGIFRDITERRRAEEELLQSKEFAESLIYAINDGITVLDRNGSMHSCNEAFCKMIGYGRQEILGLVPPFPWWPEEEMESIKSVFEKALSGEEAEFELIYKKKNGERFPVIINPSQVRDSSGRVINYVATFKDIAERKRMEKELLNAQKLESIGILAGGIAHDFNNLLTGILSNISLSIFYGDPESRVTKRLKEAEKAVLRSKDLAQQLLTFSEGGLPVKSLIHIGKLVTDSASFALLGSNVKCELSAPEDLFQVDADEGQLRQVIKNMVINAQQSMPEGGIVKVSLSNLEVAENAALKKGKYVKIEIRDHGEGIPDEHLPKIFDPYFTTKEKGSGLGLATAYSIIKNHGGHIEVHTSVGNGTVFNTYLPAPEPMKTCKEGSIKIMSGGKVLIMDDDEIIKETAGEILNYLGCKVSYANDGAEAIEVYKAAHAAGEPFGLVIMDLTIPGGMGGKEAIKHLRSFDPEVKAIISSGYSNDPIIADFGEYGFSGVILKPYRVSDLSNIVHKMLKDK